MRHWLWRLMGVLSLGGGFSGLVYCVTAALNGGNLSLWISVAIGVVLYGAGLCSGLSLIEGRPGAKRLNLIYWLIQIPVIKTPFFGFSFYCGATVAASAGLSGGESGTEDLDFAANALVGSGFEWSLIQPGASWEFGINFLAWMIVIFGGKLLRRETTLSRLAELKTLSE